MPEMYLDFLGFLSLFLEPIALVMGLVLMVLFLANAALVLNLGRDFFALSLLATSMGFIQVAGSLTTLPLRGPDVHLNFFLSVLPPLPRPNICRPASVITSNVNNSCSFILIFIR